jgi:hypothetical protein
VHCIPEIGGLLEVEPELAFGIREPSQPKCGVGVAAELAKIKAAHG